MAQPWIERADRSEHARGAIAILNVGLMHDQPDQIALRVGDDVALAALDLLSCVIAPRAAALRGFHRLAVNHSCRRARLSASRLAHRHNERVVQRGKGSVARPRVEIALNRGVGRKNHNWLKSLSFFFSQTLINVRSFTRSPRRRAAGTTAGSRGQALWRFSRCPLSEALLPRRLMGGGAEDDPTATLAVHCANGFDAGFSPYQSTRLSRYNAVS